jgi:large subunit ribosomal protein L16
MKLTPRFFKYKKAQKGKSFNKLDNLLEFHAFKFNSIKLIACSHGRITDRQYKSIYLCINKIIKKSGQINFNIFPHLPISKKPIEVRMGKGKGKVDHWVFNCKIGFTICEIQTNYKTKGIIALKAAQIRLPIITKIKI